MINVSIIIPAFNENNSIYKTIKSVIELFDNTNFKYELIVVDDGSDDRIVSSEKIKDVIVIRHPLNIGYGNALLTGIHNAQGEIIAIADADGTYPISELPSMIQELQTRGLDMLVGARQGKFFDGSLVKRIARIAFKALAEFTTGQKIPDINSGLRVMRREMVLKFAPVLCGGFSFTTTITVIALLTSHFVDHRPINYHARIGKSKVRYFRDTLRTAQILVMAILMFNPVKLYLLLACSVLIIGVIAILLTLLAPVLSGAVLLASMFWLTAVVLLGLGFIAEQRRAHMERVNSSRKKFDTPES